MPSAPAPAARHDLFLSYRCLDAERVAPLVAALRRRGLTVWQDTEEIDPLTRASALGPICPLGTPAGSTDSCVLRQCPHTP